MEVRFSTGTDITEIVSLLKQSLGESLMPKSENYWMWKHVNNPFGQSPVLLALDQNKLIGVRAFMKWKWRHKGKEIESVRAVDTATHPDYQGKGIFSKLTKSLLTECETRGVSFVFNTPNKISKPGYLKMGWEEVGRLPICIHAPAPLSALLSFAIRGAEKSAPPDSSVSYFLNHSGVGDLLNASISSDFLETNYTASSLKWRYKDVPVASYHACGVEHGNELTGLLFYRLKPTRRLTELRITDIFTQNGDAFISLRKELKKKAKEHKADFITMSGTGRNLDILPLWSTLRSVSVGPMVTVKGISDPIVLQKKFREWRPSLGDLELF